MKDRKIPYKDFSQNNAMSLKHSKVISKGDRLNWQALKDVAPITLSNELITGKFLDKKDLSHRNSGFNINNVLIP